MKPKHPAGPPMTLGNMRASKAWNEAKRPRLPPLLAKLLLGRSDKTIVMLGVLQVAFSRYQVAGGLRIAGKQRPRRHIYKGQ